MARPENISEQFNHEPLASHWHTMEIGQGQVRLENKTLVCRVPSHNNHQYHNAQLDDYVHLKRSDYPWTPPIEMTVRAWTSHPKEELIGTAGFGFWNHPFMPGGGLPRLPRAVWFFFASPPSKMALAYGIEGRGWKAATFDAITLPFFLLAPFTPIGFLLMRIPFLYQRLWPFAQRAIKVSEAQLDDIDISEPHTYKLQWRKDGVQFFVDNELIHRSAHSPKGSLGFVAWLDNQYAVVTPQGQLGLGFLERPNDQFLVLDNLSIKSID